MRLASERGEERSLGLLFLFRWRECATAICRIARPDPTSSFPQVRSENVKSFPRARFRVIWKVRSMLAQEFVNLVNYVPDGSKLPVLTGAFVAVGMPVTKHPPHRSRRAHLTHRALTSDYDAKVSGFTYPGWSVQGFPLSLCTGHRRSSRILLGHRPSLRGLRSLLDLVRLFHRCRVGGGALVRGWPPSAAQTRRAVFPHRAFTRIACGQMQERVSAK